MRAVALTFIACLVLWTPPCFAQETGYESHISSGRKNLQGKNYGAAERQFRAALGERPDSHEAALLLGIALNRAGDEEAESVLKRALYLDPADPQTSLELGVYFYKTAVYSEAAEFFENVIDLAPGTKFAAEAQSYLGKIVGRRAKRWTLHLGTGVEYDSNVVLAPDEGFLSASVSKKSDKRLVVNLGAVYRVIDSDSFRSELSYAVYQSLHSELSRFNLLSQTVEFSTTFRPAKGLRLSGKYALDYDRVENYTYSLSQQVMPVLSVTPSRRLTTSLWYRYKYIDFKNSIRFPDNGTRSGNINSIGVMQAISVGKSALVRAGFSYDSHAARALYQQYIGRRGYGVVDVNLPRGFAVSLYFGYVKRSYRGPDPLFLIPRVTGRRHIPQVLKKRFQKPWNSV